MNDHVLNEENKRAEFSQLTRETLAKKSGYICAYQGCKRMTVAGSADRKSGLTMVGVAAHITAASNRGPRYDPSTSSEERASEANDIWTCQIHGKLIDDNPSKYTVDVLCRWKRQHEDWVFNRVESGIKLFSRGVFRLSFRNVGEFSGEFEIPFGRNNALVGAEESDYKLFCQILSAFSGGNHWKKFKK